MVRRPFVLLDDAFVQGQTWCSELCLTLHAPTLHRGSVFRMMVGDSQLGTAGSISRAVASAPLISPCLSCFRGLRSPSLTAALRRSVDRIKGKLKEKEREPHINEKYLLGPKYVKSRSRPSARCAVFVEKMEQCRLGQVG